MLSELNSKTLRRDIPNLPRVDMGSKKILDVVKDLGTGMYIYYIQSSPDSPAVGSVGTCIVNKAGSDYIFIYIFMYNRIYYAAASSSTTSIAWEKIL